MATAIHRLIKYGIQIFWRQRLLSIATMIVILLALLVFHALIVSSVVARTALDALQEKIDISIFFKTTAPEDEILRVKSGLEGMEEVKTVENLTVVNKQN